MNMRKRRKNSEYVEMAKRVAVYSAIMFVLAIIQCSFFARIEILPATPCLIIGAVAVIAVIDSSETAAVSGIIGGVIIDALGGTGIYLSPLLCFATGLAIGFFAKKMMTGYLSWLALMPIACLMRGLFTLLEVFLYARSIEWGYTALHIILPELICTLVFALPLYPLIRLCISPLLRRGSFMKGIL